MRGTEQAQGQAWKSRLLRPLESSEDQSRGRPLKQPESERLFAAPQGYEESSEGFGCVVFAHPSPDPNRRLVRLLQCKAPSSRGVPPHTSNSRSSRGPRGRGRGKPGRGRSWCGREYIIYMCKRAIKKPSLSN